MQQSVQAKKGQQCFRKQVTVLTTFTLKIGALCYPGMHFSYLIHGLSPKKSRRSHNDFNDQYGHNSHNGFTRVTTVIIAMTTIAALMFIASRTFLCKRICTSSFKSL